MIRTLAALTLLALLLSGCARPPVDQVDAVEMGGVAEPVMEPALTAPAVRCSAGDDGIGGTGCAVD